MSSRQTAAVRKPLLWISTREVHFLKKACQEMFDWINRLSPGSGLPQATAFSSALYGERVQAFAHSVRFSLKPDFGPHGLENRILKNRISMPIAQRLFCWHGLRMG
jgi:hypothetical protein